MSKFQDAMRRVITGDNAQGQSVIIIDGGPSSEIGSPDLGGLFEIWEDATVGALTPSAHEDLGTTRPVLGPRKGNFQVRWFVISPLPEGVSVARTQSVTSFSNRGTSGQPYQARSPSPIMPKWTAGLTTFATSHHV